MALKLLTSLGLLCALASGAPQVPWEAAERDAKWFHKHEILLNQTRQHASEIKAVFLGDSITEHWLYEGKQVWTDHFANRGAFNYGVGGDGVEHVIWRLQHGEFEKVNPKVVVFMIGANNVWHNTTGEIAMGVFACLNEIHAKMPNAKIILMSTTPEEPIRIDSKIVQLNSLIARFTDQNRIHWVDLTSHFESAVGNEFHDLYNSDHTHLSPLGYQMWHRVMEPTFARLIV